MSSPVANDWRWEHKKMIGIFIIEIQESFLRFYHGLYRVGRPPRELATENMQTSDA